MKENIKDKSLNNRKKTFNKLSDSDMYLIDLKNLLSEKPYIIEDIIYHESSGKYYFIFVNKKGDVNYIYKVSKLDFKKKFVENVTFISNILNKEFRKHAIEDIVEEIFDRDKKIHADVVKYQGDKFLVFKKKLEDKTKGRRYNTKLFLSLNIPSYFIKDEKVDFTFLMIYIIDYYLEKAKKNDNTF